MSELKKWREALSGPSGASGVRTDAAVISRLGPVLLVIGGVLALIGGATHGDLPESSGVEALRFLEQHPAYALVHFVSIFGGVLWAVGLAGSDEYLSAGLPRSLLRAAGRVALIGAGVLAVQFSLDGYGAEALVALWSEPDVDPAMVETIARLAPEMLVGVGFAWVMLLYGVAPLLAGWALIIDGSAFLGWVGLVLGVLVSGGAWTVVLDSTIMPDWLVFAGGVIGGSLWGVALGIHRLLLVRRQ